MEAKSKSVPFIFGLVIVLIAVPLYFLHGSTLEKKRQNAVQNAREPWAPKTLLDTAYLYGSTSREPKAFEIYVEWLKIYGGDDVARLLFPERADEIDEYEDDSAHAFKPPRVNTTTPHPRTAEVLMYFCEGQELRLNNGTCRNVMAFMLDDRPENLKIDEALLNRYQKFRGRLKTKSF